MKIIIIKKYINKKILICTKNEDITLASLSSSNCTEFLTLRPYHPLLQVCLRDCIQSPHGADVSLCWLVNTGGSWPSRLSLKNTPTTPLQRRKPTPSPNECPEYDTKQSDDEAPVILEIRENAEYPFIAIAPRSTLAWSSSI